MRSEPKGRREGHVAWAGLVPSCAPGADGGDARGRVQGQFAPPPSKSLLQRALVLASRAAGTTRLVGIGRPQLGDGDVAAAYAAARVLGGEFERSGADLLVHGAGQGLPWTPDVPLVAGESGTLARLLTALAALLPPAGHRTRVEARGTLRGRSSPALARSLESAGARWTPEAGAPPAGWPAEIVSAAVDGAARLVLAAPGSSQELTALLVAIAACGYRGDMSALEVTGVIPSQPYVALTRSCLRDFRAAVLEEHEPGRVRFQQVGELQAPVAPLTIEPDASAAAVALAAAALSGGELVVPGLDAGAHQGDARCSLYFSAFGCRAPERKGQLAVHSGPDRGADLDLAGEPDLAPVLAAVAAAAALRAGATSHLAGLGTLPGKESDRLATLAAGLRSAGLGVEVGAESLTIAPGPGRPAGAEPLLLDPAGDHRMVFAFALLGLVLPGIRVADPDCVAKSWPDFWEDLESLGATVARSPRFHPASATSKSAGSSRSPGPDGTGRGTRPAGG